MLRSGSQKRQTTGKPCTPRAPFPLAVLTIRGGGALLALLLSHVRRPHRAIRATAASVSSGLAAGLLLAIWPLRMLLRLHSGALAVRAAIDLLQAASQRVRRSN